MLGICELCGIETELTKHHLIPQVKCTNKYRKMKNDEGNFIMICRQCHDNIHACHSENELRDSYNTLEKLRNSTEIEKFTKWRQKHPDFNGHSKMSNKRKFRGN